MANMAEDEDILPEPQRPSLLDAVEEKNRALNKKTLLHRMVVISKMYHNNFQDIGEFYEKRFKEMVHQFQPENITGLLLLYPKHCVHVIEGCQQSLLDFITHLQRESSNGQGHMERSKILIISQDIPHRLYQTWNFRVLDIEAPNLEEYEPTEDAEVLLGDMLVQILKLGAYVGRQPKMAMKNVLESLHEKVPELLPQQDLIGYLLERDEMCVLTPEEYLAGHTKPFDVTLASELIWPMPVRLFPYN